MSTTYSLWDDLIIYNIYLKKLNYLSAMMSRLPIKTK